MDMVAAAQTKILTNKNLLENLSLQILCDPVRERRCIVAVPVLSNKRSGLQVVVLVCFNEKVRPQRNRQSSTLHVGNS